VSGRVIDLEAAAAGGPRERLFEGEALGVRSLKLAPGEEVRIETAPGQERVLVAVAGRGLCRADAFEPSGRAQPLAPGRIGVLRAGEWCEISAEGPEAFVVVEVVAPEPVRRT
jgi:quercetin dioxygenase-like cupin family protein